MGLALYTTAPNKSKGQLFRLGLAAYLCGKGCSIMHLKALHFLTEAIFNVILFEKMRKQVRQISMQKSNQNHREKETQTIPNSESTLNNSAMRSSEVII